MAKIYDIRTRQRKDVTRMEFMGLLDALEKEVEQLQLVHPNPVRLNEAVDIIRLMKWNGLYNPKFRDENTEPLEQLLDDIYIKLNSGG